MAQPADTAPSKPDPQIVEIIGRNLLVAELLGAGLEIAVPIRDRGIDLIAYADTGPGVSAFRACPIQMKAASHESFSIDSKYERFPGLLIAFVWHVWDRNKTATYALTHPEAVAVANKMEYTGSRSWESGKYTNTYVSPDLHSLLDRYRMTPEKWRMRVAEVSV